MMMFQLYQFYSSLHHQLKVDLPDSIPKEIIISFTGNLLLMYPMVLHAKNERFLKKGIITVDTRNA